MPTTGLVEEVPDGVLDDLRARCRVRQPLAIGVKEGQEVRGQLQGNGHSVLHVRVYTRTLTYRQDAQGNANVIGQSAYFWGWLASSV
jgi:hypothetical protein